MLYQCGFEYKLCSLIRDLHYKIILQRRTTKAVFISGYRYQFLQRRARKTRANRTHGAAATHCPAHLVLCPLRRCTAGNALKRRSVNTRREPSPSPARSCGPTHNGRKGFVRRRPSRKPFPDHLPRERVVVPVPTSCACCGSDRLSKVGEDVTETLEVIPRRWKVIQTVREKFTCRDCERISQPPAPFHATPRGWAGPNLLATILFEKYGQHLPLNRQRDRYAREGVDLSLSTLADQVGACAVALKPLHDLIAAHVLAASRLHGDDTPVPVLAKGKTDTARAWVYVRDDAPFGGPDPPAALFHYSRDRSGDHPVEHLRTFAGILQADAYAGYRRLYAHGRSPGPVTEALCWAHGRRKFYELADIAANKRRGKRARRRSHRWRWRR